MPLLAEASVDDLSVLVDYLTDKGAGRLALDADVTKTLTVASKAGAFGIEERLAIGAEIQAFGGNSLINAVRGTGILYREVVRDVADRQKVAYNNFDTVETIENAILLVVAEKAWEKMSEDERKALVKELGLKKTVGIGPAALAAVIAAIRASGFAAFKFAAVVAQVVAKQVLGRGLAVATTAPLMKGMSVLAGPIGWAIAAAWTAFDMASPAYRVTVPCVIQLAYMRKKLQSVECSQCGAWSSGDCKFCAECGGKLQRGKK
ncbi:MAG: hypothetical protein HY856_21710 [Burkholderiales bacterium]|nr:hypothetical protein [Burkholderiales bacterium]